MYVPAPLECSILERTLPETTKCQNILVAILVLENVKKILGEAAAKFYV